MPAMREPSGDRAEGRRSWGSRTLGPGPSPLMDRRGALILDSMIYLAIDPVLGYRHGLIKGVIAPDFPRLIVVVGVEEIDDDDPIAHGFFPSLDTISAPRLRMISPF